MSVNGTTDFWYPITRDLGGRTCCIYIRPYYKDTLAKQICYQFSGGVEVCIEGDSYQITSEEIIQTPPNNGHYYDIWVERKRYNPALPHQLLSNFVGVIDTVHSSLFPVSMVDYVIPNSLYYQYAGNPPTWVLESSITRKIRYANGGEVHGVSEIAHDDVYRIYDIIDISVTPNQSYKVTEYCIKIYDSELNLIHEHCQQSDSPPNVEVIPPFTGCKLSNKLVTYTCWREEYGDKLIRTNKGNKLIFSLLRRNLDRKPIDLRDLSIPDFPVELIIVATLYKDKDCGFPPYQIDCHLNPPIPKKPKPEIPKPPEKVNCPPNTKYECDEDGTVCCYDECYRLIKTFKKPKGC